MKHKSQKENTHTGNTNPFTSGTDSSKKFLEHWHIISLWLVIYDLLVTNGAFFLALWLRFDCQFSNVVKSGYLEPFLRFIPIYSVIIFVVFNALHLYQSIWRFASYREFEHIILGCLVVSICHIAGITVFFRVMPISYYIIGPILQTGMIILIRFAYRFVLLERSRIKKTSDKNVINIMIIGAGRAGQMILRDITGRNAGNEKVCCIIDDNPNKWNRYIDAIPIVGGCDAIPDCADKYNIDKIYLCIPSASASRRRDILEICKKTGCAMKNLPSIYQLMDSNITTNSMQEVSVEDLLGREPVVVEMGEIFQFIRDKVVMVTGGGGSIGSELCRQIAKNCPKQLIIFDIYENNAYSIGLELRDKYPELDLQVLIGSVRDSKRINQVFAEYKPEIVYHAAAHKHVPLMEDSPCEAIKNNAIGTYKTAYAAMIHGCKRFVLISTDKAVNPTNIMGASKRICELVIQALNQKVQDGNIDGLHPIYMHADEYDGTEQKIENTTIVPSTGFVAVRFGNVLASNGSVIPLFKDQIAKGGPVTVTHPEIVRYFMTIPEATALVLQAGTYANGGEIFVLDMGSPVKIDTLARNLICLSGLKPDIDIPIIYTGLRPGEKLYEEKLMSEEGLRKTPNNLIHIGNPLPLDVDTFLPQLQKLMQLAYDGQEEDVIQLVEKMVPTYRRNQETSGTISSNAEKTDALAVT